MRAIRVVVASAALAAVFSLAPVVTADQGSKPGFTRGDLRNGTYANTFFGLRLDLPEGWVALSDDEILNLPDAAFLAQPISLARSGVPTSSLPLVPLAFLVNMNDGGLGANVILYAESLGSNPGPLAMLGYAEAQRREFQKFNPQLPIKLETGQIGGKTFRTTAGLSRRADGVMKHRWFGAESNGYALNALATYLTAAQHESVHALLAAITFPTVRNSR